MCATIDAANGRAPPRPVELRPFCSLASLLHSGHIKICPLARAWPETKMTSSKM